VHLFWLSHEEKRPWVELSMRGQPWLELELHGRPWECSLERGETGKEKGRGGAQLGPRLGLAMGATGGEFGPWLLCSVRSLAARVRKKTAGRKEKRRERKETKEKKRKEEKEKKENIENYGMKRIIFVLKTRSRIIK
jgi:hypothetical protein